MRSNPSIAASIASAAMAAMFFQVNGAQAQTYPTRTVTTVVPFAAGGPTDIIARIVGEHMGKVLGQQFIVENVAGAGGTTGTTRVTQSKPDGYTIMMGHMGTHGAAPALYPKLRYDPVQDFEPIGMAAGTPILIVARKNLPASDLKSFIAYVKASQGKASEGHAGVGSVSHSTCTMFNAQIGVKATRVAYGGTGPAMNDLVGGQIDYMCDQIVNVVEQIKGGSIKAYAIATAERSPALPDVPTTREAGLPSYEVSAWNAMFAPKGTPKDIVAKLNDALVKGLNDATTRKRLLDLGAILPTKQEQTSEWLGEFVKKEVARWAPVLKGAGGDK